MVFYRCLGPLCAELETCQRHSTIAVNICHEIVVIEYGGAELNRTHGADIVSFLSKEKQYVKKAKEAEEKSIRHTPIHNREVYVN